MAGLASLIPPGNSEMNEKQRSKRPRARNGGVIFDN